MLRNKSTLLLVGLAGAYAAYRFSKMTPDQKDNLKRKAQKLMDDYLPEDVKSMFGTQSVGKNFTGDNSSAPSGL